jgi:hypothetical protein
LRASFEGVLRPASEANVRVGSGDYHRASTKCHRAYRMKLALIAQWRFSLGQCLSTLGSIRPNDSNDLITMCNYFIGPLEGICVFSGRWFNDDSSAYGIKRHLHLLWPLNENHSTIEVKHPRERPAGSPSRLKSQAQAGMRCVRKC